MDRPIKGVVAALYAIIVAVGTLQVLSRFVFGFSLSWSEELIRYLFFWSVLLTAAVIAGEGGHLRVDYLSERMSPPLRRGVEHFNDLLFLAFAGALVWLGGELAWRAAEGGSRSPAMEVSMAWVYAAFPIGGALMIGLHLRHWRERVRSGK